MLAIMLLLAGSAWDAGEGTATTVAGAGLLQRSAEFPRYLTRGGRPILLVTSGEHYGAVLNLDFDFEPYLDTLQASGLNQTRTFAGTYREVPGSFQIQHNTLAPAPNRFLSPWVRTAEAGGDRRFERFDLDRFEGAYFERLRSFLAAAERRGVVVELVLFCPLYSDELWEASPMNPANNEQGLPAIGRDEVLTLKHQALVDRQLAFVRKVVEECNAFDNLYYEICNEPYFGGVTLDWQREVARTIVETEAGLPKQHLIAQNIANNRARIEDPDPNVSIFNFHYADPAAALENLHLERVLGNDETGFEGRGDFAYRSEAWHFVLSGGGVISNLDYSYTVDHEDGRAAVEAPTPGGGGDGIRRQLGFLRQVVESVDFFRMAPRPEMVRVVTEGAGREPVAVSALAMPETSVVMVYVSRTEGAKSEVESLEVDLSAGHYRLQALDPITQATSEIGVREHEGGGLRLETPAFGEDLVLVIDGRRGG